MIEISFQVDSVNKHGILLDVVQVISDMNLVIRKAYISSDGVWFMDGKLLFSMPSKLILLLLLLSIIDFDSDPGINLILFSVFNVIDRNGNKIKYKEVIDYIQGV